MTSETRRPCLIAPQVQVHQIDVAFPQPSNGRGGRRNVIELKRTIGRSLEKPPNQQRGFELLAKVSDDLDSIFYHLKENPMLVVYRRGCKRRNNRGRKRLREFERAW